MSLWWWVLIGLAAWFAPAVVVMVVVVLMLVWAAWHPQVAGRHVRRRKPLPGWHNRRSHRGRYQADRQPGEAAQ